MHLPGAFPVTERRRGTMRYRPIRRNSEFGRVYARGKSYVNPALVMYVLKTRGKKTLISAPDPVIKAEIRQSGSCGPLHGEH